MLAKERAKKGFAQNRGTKTGKVRGYTGLAKGGLTILNPFKTGFKRVWERQGLEGW
jgi:hypothetical protein